MKGNSFFETFVLKFTSQSILNIKPILEMFFDKFDSESY